MKSEFKKEKERKEKEKKSYGEKRIGWRKKIRKRILRREKKELNWVQSWVSGACLCFTLEAPPLWTVAVTHNVTPLRGPPFPAMAPRSLSTQSYSIPSDHNHTSTYALQQVAAIRRIVNMNVFGNQLCALEQVSSFSWASFPPFVKEGVELNDFLRPFRLSYFINW